MKSTPAHIFSYGRRHSCRLLSAAALAATPTLPADTGLNFNLTPAQLSQTLRCRYRIGQAGY